MAAMDMEKYAEELYQKVKDNFPDDKIDTVNVFMLIRIAMEEVERFKELEGRQKKELVIRIIHEAVEDYVLDDVENENIHMLVDNFVDVIVDNFCDIDLGNLGINEEKKKKIMSFLKKIVPCCFKSE